MTVLTRIRRQGMRPGMADANNSFAMMTVTLKMQVLVCILCLSTVMAFSSGFQVQKTRVFPAALFASSRRHWMVQVASAAIMATTSTLSIPSAVCAEDATTAVEMKTFIDPQGYFAMRLPKNYFTLRRSAKGDLPDAKTGQGRRGSSIFTAGDMSKAEVVAVERYVLYIDNECVCV
jgi:hypothetical protein